MNRRGFIKLLAPLLAVPTLLGFKKPVDPMVAALARGKINIAPSTFRYVNSSETFRNSVRGYPSDEYMKAFARASARRMDDIIIAAFDNQ